MLDDAARLWWGRLPALVYRLSPQVGLAFADGIHLAEWPPVAAIAPPAALLLGLVLGWGHPGIHLVWAENVLLISAIVVLGTMSASLGGLLVLGFAIGDFLLGNQHWPVHVPHAAPGVLGAVLPPLARLRLPLLIGYFLLWVVVARVPLLVKALLSDALRGRTGQGAKVLAIAGHALLTAGAVWVWINALPVLIRPRFTWIGALTLPPSVLEPLQAGSFVVIGAAVVASVVRTRRQAELASRPDVQARFDALQAPVIEAARPSTTPGRARLWLRAAGVAAMTTLLASGILANVPEAVVLFAGTSAVYAARTGLVTIPLGRWPALIGRVPMVVRLIGGWIAVDALAQPLLSAPAVTAGPEDLFRPFVITTVLGLAIMYLLVPYAGRRAPAARAGA